MKKVFVYFAVVLVCVLGLVVVKNIFINQPLSANESGKTINIEIDYGNVLPNRSIDVPFEEGRTAVQLLQTVAKVETQPVAGYVFVVSIDGVCGERGDMAWYYSVNGKSDGQLAYLKTIDNDAEHIKWVYKKDTCSAKVDNK